MDNYISQNASSQIKNALHLPTCHSTSSFALDYLKENEVENGWIVYTFDQTNGRGQAGNVWESEPNKNLTFSIVYHPEFLLPRNQFLLNIIVSIAIVRFLESIHVKAEIKWPNDIYINNRKIAGILIENQMRGEMFRNSVIGIGLNINQASFQIPKATSVFIENNIQYNLPECIELLRSHLDFQITRLKNGEAEKINEEYIKLLYLRNKSSLFKTGGTTFAGSIKGIDENGKLRVLTENGEKVFNFKEIVFLS